MVLGAMRTSYGIGGFDRRCTGVSFTETRKNFEVRMDYFCDLNDVLLLLLLFQRGADENELQKLPYRLLVFPMGMLLDGSVWSISQSDIPVWITALAFLMMGMS